jgi:hypothetical protein
VRLLRIVLHAPETKKPAPVSQRGFLQANGIVKALA